MGAGVGLIALRLSLSLAGLTSTTLAGNCSSGAHAASGKSTCGSSSAAALASHSAKPDIVDTAVSAGSFNTLVAAVQAAGLVDALKSEGPFTVFAPTDDAFAKLPKGTLQSLLKPENKALLTSILTYHVVPGRVMAADVVKLTKARTVQGSDATIQVREGSVYVDGARVTATDIKAGNGVIHVIDSVIIPD